jgi:hypothetical protein
MNFIFLPVNKDIKYKMNILKIIKAKEMKQKKKNR